MALVFLGGCDTNPSHYPKAQAKAILHPAPQDLGNLTGAQHIKQNNAHPASTQISSNYAGYTAQYEGNGNFSDVVGTWTMPAIHCSANETSEAAFWVGLTGKAQQPTIAQIATIGTCQNGQANYEVDWELYPALAQTITNPVQPGDQISATVSYQQGQFHLTMHDARQGWSFSTSQRGSATNATVAECITEAPTLVIGGTQRTITNLANFGQVNISCQANNTPIGSYTQLSQYQMVAGNAATSTSSLGPSGSDFTVIWQGK